MGKGSGPSPPMIPPPAANPMEGMAFPEPVIIMPPLPELPPMPELTEIQGIDWDEKRRQLQEQESRKAKALARKTTGRGSTVLTGPEEWEEEPTTTKTLLTGSRKRS